jgi:hypothetical protein
MFAPAAALQSCGDGVCEAGEDWIGCFADCPQPANTWAIVGSGDAQARVGFEKGITVTVVSRMTGVPVGKVEIAAGRTVDRPFRIVRENDTGIINPYSYFSIRCKVPLQAAWIYFSVDKDWLAGRGMTVDDVGVFAKVGGWTPVGLVRTGQDAGKAYYVFEVSKFGEFAIGSKKGLEGRDTTPQREFRPEPEVVLSFSEETESSGGVELAAGFSVLVMLAAIALKKIAWA